MKVYSMKHKNLKLMIIFIVLSGFTSPVNSENEESSTLNKESSTRNKESSTKSKESSTKSKKPSTEMKK